MNRAARIGALVLAFAAAASAAEPAKAPAKSVDAIVAEYVVARGGLAKIRSVQTLRQTGRAYGEGGRQAAVRRELKRPGKVRFEFTVQGVTGVYVTNGGRGWMVSPFDGEMDAKPLPDEAVADAVEQADFEGPLVDWKKKGHKLEYAGRETIDGREADRLKLTLASGVVRYESIDVKTHFLLRTETTRKLSDRDVRVQATFGDHKKTNGILFPRRVEIGAADRPQRLRILVDAIEVNPPISDARFDRLAGK
ncbi:MAG TPA: hypothetical protein VFB67_09550 [Candidatus Polarisedimenticolaceae bacterium]|nr:hypothetical protein [Candidatus Polarisedimenticolaceae bacterium]